MFHLVVKFNVNMHSIFHYWIQTRHQLHLVEVGGHKLNDNEPVKRANEGKQAAKMTGEKLSIEYASYGMSYDSEFVMSYNKVYIEKFNTD